MSRGELVWIPFVIAACGGAGATGSGGDGRSAASGACLPIAPMRLLALEHGREWEPMASLASDGTISQRVSKRQAPSFRIEGDRVRATGAPSMTCGADGVLRVDGTQLTMRFDGQGALTDGGGMRIFVADSGAVEAALGGPSKPMPWRVEGVTAGTRRTAEILVFAALASVDWSYR